MPSAFRNPKNLPEWLELDFFRRARSLGRWKSFLIWSALAVLVTGAAASVFVPRSATWLQANRVSAAHTFINGDCGQCHTDPLQTPRRFLRWDGKVRAVSNEACSKCHDGPAHNDRQLVDLDCAPCHREHRGRTVLARMPDRDCLACHADLKANNAAGEDCRFQDVTSFPHGHPQFALWQGRDPLVPAGRDPGQLRFNHAVHLAEGLLQPDGTRKVMDCKNCHRLDEAGRYMLPLSYNDHCRTCHPLSVRLTGHFADPAIRQAAEEFARLPAPHPVSDEDAQVVRAVLRDRLLSFARKYRIIPGKDGSLDLLFPKPRRPQPVTHQVWAQAERDPTEAETASFVEPQLTEQERRLFSLSGGCFYCHLSTGAGPNRPAAPSELPQLLPANLRSRWLVHSRFRHTAHRLMQCTECHDATTSTATSDILMPRLETCARCHDAGVGARHDCVECHLYHHRGRAPQPH